MSSSSVVKAGLRDLGTEQLSALKTAVSHLLSTSIAEQTYAQIVDGLPTSDVWDGYTNERHEPIENHHSLCAGSLETAKALRSTFDTSNLFLDASIVQAFQNTPLESPNFPLRLIEITAAACHEIAVLLFQGADNGYHKDDIGWVLQPLPIIPPPGWPYPVLQPTVQPLRTVFFHASYQDDDQYPNGVADIVGYWAEAQIFGGVVLFDRGESEHECKDVYLHPFGSGRPIFQLSEAQIKRLSNFISSYTPITSTAPFPFNTFERHTRRVDPWDAWTTEHIFRSRYERKLPERRVYNCKRRVEDYPEDQDLLKQIQEKFVHD